MLHGIGAGLAITHFGVLKYWKTTQRRNEAKTMKRMASFYTIVAGELYHRGYSQPLLKCMDGRCAQMIIKEMHEGNCENYAGSQALMAKILRASDLWSNLK